MPTCQKYIVNNFKWNCGASFEDAIHYFLECPLYLNERRTLLSNCDHIQGRIQDLKLGGADLKKIRRAEGGAKILGVFRVKNHDFTPKHLIFSNFRGGAALDPPLIPISILKLCSLGTISIVMASTPKYLEKFELL